MSVVIKGLSMPKNCLLCPCCGRQHYCQAMDDEPYVSETYRPKDCPLVKIPTPHGRLIDADALMECRLEPNHYEELKDGYIPDYDLDSAPTIIEAEVSE